MRWVRSWPRTIPPHRAYVVDDLERIVLDDFDYGPALAALDDDVIVLEWDMAMGQEAMRAFDCWAADRRANVLAAPYRLYTVGERPVWAHRRVNEIGRERWVTRADVLCDYFSFGCTYLPRALVRRFLAAPAPARGCPPGVDVAHYNDERLHDQTFSMWHAHRSGQPPVVITWGIEPVHLHT